MTPPAKLRARRRALAGLVVTVLLVGVLFFGLFPTRTWLEQRREASSSQAELDELDADIAQVEAQQEALETDEAIEEVAREEWGWVRPGEEVWNILPAPTDPIGLPEGWPFTGVERALGAG